jgi:hypothetical protein
MLARQPDAEEVGLVKAGQLIDEHFVRIRETLAEAARVVPANQRKFWDGVQEFVSRRIPE